MIQVENTCGTKISEYTPNGEQITNAYGLLFKECSKAVEVDSERLIKDVEDEFNDVHADIFLWSLLHEVGHHETWDDLTNEEMSLSQEMKYAISECENLRPNDRDKIYFYIPDEYLATEWAAQYMRDNVQEVTKFWNTLQPLILNFYKKHGIER